ncbi:MAG: hypothetical protein Q9220_002075 [cf. Caloplaca sp. 1 TL-2023]
MPRVQSDYDREYQAFRRWIQDTQRRGIGGSGHASTCCFVPVSALRKYLGASGRVESLLGFLFGKDSPTIVDAETIRKHYIRPLAILLLIGHGAMIKHFVQYESLQDQRLPYRSRPTDFPFSSQDAAFFEKYFEHQWQFCTPELEYNMELFFHDEQTLPILEREEIGQGGNGLIYRIVVDREYNKLVPPGLQVPEQAHHLLDTFVLKTYRGEDAKNQFEAERDAFKRLRYDKMPTDSVIAYYGNFVDKDTYNIILEYADQGDLAKFLKRTPKPPTIEAMLEFWERLCRLAHGLATIHGFPPKIRNASHGFLGWHQDIKPENILVFSTGGTSKYDVLFKIADLSLCHFKKREHSPYDASDLSVSGTRKYGTIAQVLFSVPMAYLILCVGAPETYSRDLTSASIPTQVQQHVDVWSLGCIFSEAAVWSYSGPDYVMEYERQRRDEVEKILGYRGESIFHDCNSVLPVVLETHQFIRDGQQMIDRITVRILDVVEKRMLLKEDQGRYSAKQVFDQFKQAIDDMRVKLELPTNGRSLVHQGHSQHMHDHERPLTPPNVPPGYSSTRNTTPRIPERNGMNIPLPARPRAANIMQPNLASHHIAHSFRPYPSETADGLYQTPQSSSPFGSFSSKSVSLHDLPEPPEPAASTELTSLDYFNACSIDTRKPRYPQGRRHPFRETIGESSIRAKSPSLDNESLRRSQTEKRPYSHPHGSEVGVYSDPLPQESFRSRHEKLRTTTTGSPEQRSAQIYESPTVPLPQRFDEQHQVSEPQRPTLSLEDALRWKRKKKDHDRPYLNGQENLTYLNARDHIFLVDNSATMHKHRDEILEVISVLAYILKTSDEDGLDVYFTQSKTKIHSGKTTKVLNAVRQEPFEGISNMRGRLSHILQEHKNKFGNSTGAPSLGWRKKPKTTETRTPLSFYILTNGIWQPKSPVGQVIEDLVASLQEHKLPKEHVGIQFIAFGHDKEGLACLNELDHGLGLKDKGM